MRNHLGTIKHLLEKHLLSRISSAYKLNYKSRGTINFIDVGSVGGLPDPWRSNANLVRFLLNFEPNEAPSRNAGSMTYNTAVWESDATLPFYVYKGFNKTGSSLFKPNLEYVRANYDSLKKRGSASLAETWFERTTLLETVALKCRTLDNILQEELPGTPFHFVKIDAQGAEYNILKGAKELLATSCIGLHLELFTLPLYETIALLPEVEAYLAGLGFRLVKKFPAHGTFESQHDCLFLKENVTSEAMAVVRAVYGLG